MVDGCGDLRVIATGFEPGGRNRGEQDAEAGCCGAAALISQELSLKIFVTGGAGFIGSNFVRHVLALGHNHQVVNFDKLTYAGNLANLESVAADPNYSFVRGDICDAAAVSRAMAGCDVVVHFAAESHVDRSIYEPAPVVETNVTGTFVLLQVARETKIKKFVHVSTDEVYGDIPAGKSSDEEY